MTNKERSTAVLTVCAVALTVGLMFLIAHHIEVHKRWCCGQVATCDSHLGGFDTEPQGNPTVKGDPLSIENPKNYTHDEQPVQKTEKPIHIPPIKAIEWESLQLPDNVDKEIVPQLKGYILGGIAPNLEYYSPFKKPASKIDAPNVGFLMGCAVVVLIIVLGFRGTAMRINNLQSKGRK